MLPDDILETARRLVASYTASGLKVVTAESCTGGLVAAAITDVPGSSAVLERGFVTYSNEAKASTGCFCRTPEGARGGQRACRSRNGGRGAAPFAGRCGGFHHGIAGPGGATGTKPVGLVHLAVARSGRATVQIECRFGDPGRRRIREAAGPRGIRSSRGRARLTPCLLLPETMMVLVRILVLAAAAVSAAFCAHAADVTAREITEQLFRAAGPVDLSGRDLEGLDLSLIDFKKSRLSKANMFGVNLTGSNLAGPI